MLRLAPIGLLALFAPAIAAADVAGQCHVVDVGFTPADHLQIAVWVEDPLGNYIDTVYLTQQTGTFGLGNRPGRMDFNSGPVPDATHKDMWPYGRRLTVLPVWAHRHGLSFPMVIFQNAPDDPDVCEGLVNAAGDPAYSNCGENNLSHPFSQSSRENHFCRPLQPGEAGWDSGTCASSIYTDKGKFSTVRTSVYPPRQDVSRVGGTDSPSVDLYQMLNPFDAVTQATPAGGQPAEIVWPIPQTMPPGDYVMWVEVAKEFDMNATYNATSYPSPPATGPKGISWADYGVAYRGQPSVVYEVPFTIGTSESSATTSDYVGYGDPSGTSTARDPHPPDATITTDTPGSGASRLQLVSDAGTMYRVRVDARPEFDYVVPGPPSQLEPMTIGTSSIALGFRAPGDDGTVGKVTGYQIRYRATEMTEDNFDASTQAIGTVLPGEPGSLQTVQIDGLLPETDYWVGVRAFDDCHNTSDTTILQVRTADRQTGEVDACFVATAAYGSVMANDVDALRHFRDAMLESTVLGELAVETYYTFGPALAGVVGESDLLRATAREVLAPIVAWVRALAWG